MNEPIDHSDSEVKAPAPNSEPRRSQHSPGTPGWVKVFGLIAVALVVLVVVLHLTGRQFSHP